MKKGEFKRVTMILNPKTIENIDKLSDLIGEGNKTRVLSFSVSSMREIIEMTKNGSKIIAIDKDGNEQQLIFIS